jgi:hypothetical protein
MSGIWHKLSQLSPERKKIVFDGYDKYIPVGLIISRCYELRRSCPFADNDYKILSKISPQDAVPKER